MFLHSAGTPYVSIHGGREWGCLHAQNAVHLLDVCAQTQTCSFTAQVLHTCRYMVGGNGAAYTLKTQCTCLTCLHRHRHVPSQRRYSIRVDTWWEGIGLLTRSKRSALA